MPSTYDQYTQGAERPVLPTVEEKPRYVAAMFSRIAPRYDFMNSLMTIGQDARWRARVADVLAPLPPGAHVLDLGAGTGRLAEAIAVRHPAARVVAVDFSMPMLRHAPRQLARAAGDALELPFADAQFDAIVSAFLMRNVANVERAIAEQLRVLRPGGTLAILETTPGPPRALHLPYRLYFRQVVPWLGGLIAGDANAYTYLPESTLAFLDPARLAALLSAQGLASVRTQRLTFGTVALTLGRKP